MRLLTASAALVLAFASAVAAPPVRAAAAPEIPFERFRLDNGLTVVVHTDRKAPIVAVDVWYHIDGILLYDRPDDWVSTLKARTEAQTVDSVNAAARAVIQPSAMTWVVVGDLAKIEQGIRALGLGEVQVVDLDGKPLR